MAGMACSSLLPEIAVGDAVLRHGRLLELRRRHAELDVVLGEIAGTDASAVVDSDPEYLTGLGDLGDLCTAIGAFVAVADLVSGLESWHATRIGLPCGSVDYRGTERAKRDRMLLTSSSAIAC